MKNKSLIILTILSMLSLSSCSLIYTIVNDDDDSTSVEPYIDPSGTSSSEEETTTTETEVESESPSESESEPVPVLVGIRVTPPTKLEYETGDEFDLTGLEVVAEYELKEEQYDVPLDIEDVSITGYDMDKIGQQTVKVSYQGFQETFNIVVNKKYDEPADSLEDVDVEDLSALHNAFEGLYLNYTSSTESFFNDAGLYNYYRHYEKNYPQEKVNFYTENAQYCYPVNDLYLSVLNTGYVNLNDNYYSYSLQGDSVEDRLNYSLTEDDLTLVKGNKSYQDDLFTLDDLNAEYFVNHHFTRVSENKYASSGDTTVYSNFIDICAPRLINTGFYMTFSKVTIELNPYEGVAFRFRLYANQTQIGKLIDVNIDQENRPNWYLLFSEALIYDVGETTFNPVNNLFN